MIPLSGFNPTRFKKSTGPLGQQLFAPQQPQTPVAPYKTTITPFGPILPTAFTLPSSEVPVSAPRAVSSSVVQPPRSESFIARESSSQPKTTTAEEIVRRILTVESSSSESEDERPRSSPLESQGSTRRNSKAGVAEFKQQETAVHSPVTAPSNPAPALSPPARMAPTRTPRTERLKKKQEELEKVQQFIEEQRAVHEKIYASFDVRRVSTRGAAAPPAASSGTKQRSVSEYVNDSNNVAQLRRNIAVSSNKREVSPLPPRAPSADKRTPSASSRSPRPVSPDRIVSGVFVSYPRTGRRSLSAPPAESRDALPAQEPNLISSSRPHGTTKTGKMTASEYAELRRNLLSRSEQHAVISTGSSLT
jgi:hypothetical protein